MTEAIQSRPLPIDVVVITLGRQAEVNECIDSVLAQDYPALQLRVLDQGSTPELVKQLRLRAASEGFEFHEIGPVGVAAGRNAGYRLGTGALIVSLDNDAVFSDSTMLTRVARSFEQKTAPQVISFAVHRYDNDDPDMSCWVFPWPVESHFGQSFKTARFCGGAHAITREAFEAVGGYDEEFRFFGEELDLSFKLIRLGYIIKYQPHIAVRHMSSAEGRIDWKNGRYYNNVRNMLYLNHKHFNNRSMQIRYLLGFAAKGMVNGLIGQTWRGIRDGLALCRRYPPLTPMSAPARAYIEATEFGPRGGLWQRLKQEVLRPMDSTGRQ